jgi:hypothetical protein
MKLRASVGAAAAVVLTGVFSLGVAGSASAKTASRTLSTAGGTATITKSWVRSGNTFRSTYSGRLRDRKGDGRHVRLYVHTYGPPGLWYRMATRGRTVKFGGGPIYANHLTFSVCTYNEKSRISCSNEW